VIYTIGHSTHTPAAFLAIANHRFKVLIDIRSHPTSRWPQWQQENLLKWVPALGGRYEWAPGLGGWSKDDIVHADHYAKFGVDVRSYAGRGFPKQRIAIDAAATQTPGWTNIGLRDYSYFMSTLKFLNAAELLMRCKEDVAIMCAEAHWWRCHRSLVSDYLWHRGIDSYHIMSRGAAKPHSEVIGDRLDRYEPYIRAAWEHY
jgi:uncharacterized protein (DUF488 family)